MTFASNKTLLVAMAMTLVAMSAVAKADDIGRRAYNDGWNSGGDQQVANAQDSDPTARNSVRSHGHP